MTNEKLFILFSKEQQKYLKILKETLKAAKERPNDEDSIDIDMKKKATIEAIFMLDPDEQNIFLMKVFGGYKSTAELAEELQVSRQTLTNHISKDKAFIKSYVNEKLKQ